MTFPRLLSGLVLLAAFGSAAAAEEVRVATQPIPLYAPLYVAQHKGWLEEELNKARPGTTVKLSYFNAGAPINESFASGLQDIGLLGDTPALIGKSAGIDTRIIGKPSAGPKTIAVIVGVDSPITSARDLKGRKVGVPKASYTEHLLSLVLQGQGLTLKDVEQVNLTNGDIPPAIVAGSIDAGAVWEPILTKFEAQKAVRVLADGTGLKSGLLAIVAGSDFLKNRRDLARAFLRAYARGADFVKANPAEAARLVSDDVKLPPDLAEKVFAKLDFNPVLTAEDIAEFKKTEEYIRGIGLIRSSVDVDAFADRAVASEAGLK
ncbi:aliphatic sulfonate ABC transporter substrate-binding protein [Telmatospirillum siberiense]|uniref:Aliphatic sulfonates ABC transporter substrate-binding protein n=1 Tax=Telmatospirillum siberiense TaxID=382514 RepID=A0A2N3PYL2_9PROT|nr:aliphatic sulfonate ABC transporter substrate-binding protein [Telmatospirillum siberiense]PKU25478.1 aliphatic sulfonates ABC transporter substrate-binding protein [Telmatospirillum siberiense]